MSAVLQGYACSECAPSFYRDDDRTCQECDNYIWVLYILAFLAALTLAPLLLRVSKSQGFMSINIFVATMQITTQLQKLELDWPPYIRNFFAVLNLLSLSFSALSPRCVVSDWHYLNKVPIMNAAPPLVFVFLLVHQYVMPRLHYAVVYIFTALGRLCLGKRGHKETAPLLRSPSGRELKRTGSVTTAIDRTGAAKLTRVTSFPSSMNAAAAPTLWERLTRLTALEDIQVKSLRECLRVVAPAMMVVLSWTYVVLANVNMEFFNCMKRGDRWYLAAEPSVECYDFSTNNKHRQYFALCLIALLVYVIGIPALFATLLYRRRKVLRHREGLLRMQHERDMNKSKQKTRISTRFNTQATTDESAQSNIIGRLQLDKPMAELQNAEELYGFLFRHYKEREFWWEVVTLMRKLAFAIIINMPKAPEEQTMLAIMALFPYIAIAYQRRPHVTTYLTVMDVLGASFAGSLALSGLVMFGGYDTRLSQYAASIIQIVLIMLLVAFLCFFVVYDSIPKVKRQMRLRAQQANLKRLDQYAPLVAARQRVDGSIPAPGCIYHCSFFGGSCNF